MQRVNPLVLGVGVLLGFLLGPVTAAFPHDSADRAAVLASFDRLPLAFEANAGQTAAAVRLVARGRGYTVYLADAEMVMVLRRAPAPVPLSRDRAAALRRARRRR